MKNFLSFRAVWLVVVSLFLVIACTSRWQRQAVKQETQNTQIKDTTIGAEKTTAPTTKWPPIDTPSIMRKDNPISEFITVNGYYSSGWRMVGGPKTQMIPEEFMNKYVLPNISTNKDNELRLRGKQEDKNTPGYEHWYYTQYHKGLPTIHSLTLTIKDGYAQGFNTSFDETMDIDTIPTISEQQAWDSVKAFLAITDTRTAFPEKYRGILNRYSINEFPYPQEIINQMTYQVHLAIEPVNSNNPTKKGEILVYKFKLSHGNYVFEPTLLIDALDGAVVAYGSVNYCNHTATVDTKYGLPTNTYFNQNFCVEDVVGSYALSDNIRDITTLKQSGGTNYNYTGLPILHNSLDWNTYTNPEYATAHWALQNAYDHFSNSYSHTIGMPIQLFLDCPFDAPQAFSKYVNNTYVIYFGEDAIDAQDMNALDVMGHEFAHSIRSQVSLEVAYNDQPHATTAEAFCDILGACFEDKTRKIINLTNPISPYSWILQNDVTTNSAAKRSFIYPHAAGTCHYNNVERTRQAAFYNEMGFWKGSQYLSKYERTGIINHWFYLLTHGTTQNKKPYIDNNTYDADGNFLSNNPDGYADKFPSASLSVKVIPIAPNLPDAIDKAAQIVFDVFKQKLQNGDNFLDIAYHTLNSAIGKGYTCDEIRSIYNAWRAVGIYPDMNAANTWLTPGLSLPAGCTAGSGYTWDTDGIDNLLLDNNIINSDAQTTYPNGSAGIYLRGCNSLVQNNHIHNVYPQQ